MDLLRLRTVALMVPNKVEKMPSAMKATNRAKLPGVVAVVVRTVELDELKPPKKKDDFCTFLNSPLVWCESAYQLKSKVGQTILVGTIFNEEFWE